MNQERFYQSGFPLFFLYVEAGTVNISHFKAAKVMNIVITTYETMYVTAWQREVTSSSGSCNYQYESATSSWIQQTHADIFKFCTTTI